MRLREYVFGRRIVLVSPLPPDQVRERIRKGTSLGLDPSYEGATGWIVLGQVRLAWSVAMFGNGFRPVLTGFYGVLRCAVLFARIPKRLVRGSDVCRLGSHRIAAF